MAELCSGFERETFARFRACRSSCLKKNKIGDKKIRICKAILDSAQGRSFRISKENNACFGASWHLGFERITDHKIQSMIKKFVVEGEKLFSSYKALDNLISQMEDIPDNSKNCFLLAPLKLAEFKPQIVVFVYDPEVACRLLTLSIFIDGNMPRIKIGGPTCRMAIIYPLWKEELNISFYDYTARKICDVAKDKLLVTIPYKRIPYIIESIARCSAGRAKIEYPQEFREFLQRRLTK
jgi:uncharacterized protein (DUF169 family)